MKIVKPDDLFVQESIEQIIEAVGRTVELHTRSVLIPCPTCSGLDPFCPTCNGHQTVYSEAQTLPVIAAVRWKTMERKRYRPEGIYVDGDCTLVIPYSSEREALLPTIAAVTVDRRRCVIDYWNFHGAPINRIYIVLLEDAKITS